jgi:hypothetical protein
LHASDRVRITTRLSVAFTLASSLWASPAHADLEPAIADFLEHSEAPLRRVPRALRIIALSHVAEHCTNLFVSSEIDRDATEHCLERVIRLAQTPSVSPLHGPTTTAKLGDHGIWLAHFNIILGAYQRAIGDDAHRALNSRISAHLVRKSLASDIAHAPSHAGDTRRWPADQTAVLYSLHLFDRNYGTELALEPTRRWLDVMRTRGTERRWKLHRSEMTGKAAGAALPRGCALSFSVRYMAAFAPAEASALWRRYRDVFATDLGVAIGFREWPPGIERKADLDSGPILAGIGAAASGFAIGASLAVGDELTHLRLRASVPLARVASDAMLRADAGILAEAIEHAGHSIVAWYDE